MLTVVTCRGTVEVRGLPPDKVLLYPQSQGQSFKCLDGSMVLPRSRINDDYCDCPDGTDEPGTSACPNGSFYCANDGYVPGITPSSRVNDGICDCCDGSDEYTTTVQCPNTCLELGKQLREEDKDKSYFSQRDMNCSRVLLKREPVLSLTRGTDC